MNRPPKAYRTYVKNKYEYGATWPPGTPLELGTVGEYVDGNFVPKSHLDNFDIPFESYLDPSPTGYTSESARGVQTTWKVAGESAAAFNNVARAEAGARITFGEANAFLISAPQCYEHRIDDIYALEQEIIRRVKTADDLPRSQRWDRRKVVITHLAVAESATIIVSGSRNASIELKAIADVGPNWGTIGSLSAGVGEAYRSDIEQRIIAGSNITPFYRGMRIKPRGFLDRGYESVVSPSSLSDEVGLDGVDEATVRELAYDSLLDTIAADPKLADAEFERVLSDPDLDD